MVLAEGGFGRDNDERIFAHFADRCTTRYTPSGKFILTCGQEGKVFANPYDKPLAIESQSFQRIHRGGVICMDSTDRRVVTIGSDSALCAYDIDGEAGVKAGKQVCRLSGLPLRSVSISPDGKWAVVAGDDCKVQKIILDVEGAEPFSGPALARPIASVRVDPSGAFIAVITLGGLIVIFDQELNSVDESTVAMPSTAYFSQLAWSPNGQYLAVSGHECINVLSKDSGFTSIARLGLEDVHGETNGLMWSSDGSFLLSHDKKTVCIWSPHSSSRPWNITKYEEGQILSLSLSPDSRQAAFIDEKGFLHRQNNFLSSSDLSQLNALNKPVETVKKAKITFTAQKVEKSRKKEEAKEKSKKGEIARLASKYLSDMCDDDGMEDGDENDVGEEDDDEGGSVDLDNTSGGEEEEGDGMGLDSLDDYSVDGDELDRVFDPAPAAPTKSEPVYQTVKKHASFQPGASDPTSEHRYLAWNHVGLITSRLDEAGYRSVDIDFHDKLSTRPIRFIDDFGYSLAALSPSGAVFAVVGDETTPATVYYMAFETWHGRQTWTYQLEAGERICGVALTESFVFVATSHGWIRSFSPSGLQQPILTHAHDLVTIAAGPNNQLLLLLNQYGGTLLGQLYNVSGVPSLVFEGPLGRRADAEGLIWAGFSSNGMATCYDSSGILYGLCAKLGFCWTPLADFSAHHADGGRLWPVMVDRNELTAIHCKARFPDVLSRPIPTGYPMSLPLLQDASIQLYEPVLRTSLLDHLIDGSAGLREKDVRRARTASDKHVLELVQLAIKADKHVRALELCSLFYGEKSLELAVQLARHHRLPTLADKIDGIKAAFVSTESTSANPLPTTPRLPVRLQKESPSVVLANLTPDTGNILMAEHVPSPSSARIKRSRLELVAEATELNENESLDVSVDMTMSNGPDSEHLHYDAHHSVKQEEEPISLQAAPKKPKGLADMLSKLSSLSSSAEHQTPPRPKASDLRKENASVDSNAAPAPALRGLKQASLATMFSRPKPEAVEKPEEE